MEAENKIRAQREMAFFEAAKELVKEMTFNSGISIQDLTECTNLMNSCIKTLKDKKAN